MNSNDLITLLVEKLSIDQEQAEAMVSEWIQHLGAELSTGGQADISGMGTLILEGSKLHFELDPGFAMEVNYKYLGMKPIVISDDINIGLKEPEVEDAIEDEIEEDSVLEPNDTAEMDEIPPSEEVIGDEGESDAEELVEPEAETEDVSEGTDSEELAETEVGEEAEPEKIDSEHQNEEESEPEEIDSEHQDEVADQEEIEEPDETEPEQPDESKVQEEVAEKEEKEESEEQEEEPEELDEATKARIARRTAALRSTRKEKKSNNIPLWVGLGVILVAAIVAGWQFYLQPVMQNPASLIGSSEELNAVIPGVDSLQSTDQSVSQPILEENQQVDQQVEALSQNSTSDREESPAPAAEEAVVSSNKKDSVVSAPLNATSPNNIPPGQPKYGLTGVVNSQANDGYTLVLFSLSNRQSAMEKYQLYRDQGYRSLVSPVTSERYGLMWRVSIGQFATVNEALSAAEELPTELAKDYFITKI